MNADSYRMLMLVREFDDRLGWMKWQYKSCAEWLAWRCGISLWAAREKVRTAHALRTLPKISAAFADGRVSYTKVRALTRVAQAHDEGCCCFMRCGRLRSRSKSVFGRCATSRRIPWSMRCARVAGD